MLIEASARAVKTPGRGFVLTSRILGIASFFWLVSLSNQSFGKGRARPA